MDQTVLTHFGKIENIDNNQVYRYLGMGKNHTPEIDSLIKKNMPKVLSLVKPQACYLIVDSLVRADEVDFSYFAFRSKNLSKLLADCSKTILCCATLGQNIDFFIRQSFVVNKAEALVINSIAICAIEKYMFELSRFFKEEYKEYNLRPRFSPGYGDVKIEVQKDLLPLLDTKRKIGVALNDSLLMTPEKSVSCFIGLSPNGGCVSLEKDCDECSNTNCEFRLK